MVKPPDIGSGVKTHPRFLTRQRLIFERPQSGPFVYAEGIMELIVEIRAAEGGSDAKLLVLDQYAIYAKMGARRGL